VTESLLREVFNQFGDIADVLIKRHTTFIVSSSFSDLMSSPCDFSVSRNITNKLVMHLFIITTFCPLSERLALFVMLFIIAFSLIAA
jgi:hypothetical protein